MKIIKKYLHAILASLIVALMSVTIVYATTTISGSSISGASGTLNNLTVSGNVGIGTTGPGTKLDVWGTAGGNNLFNVASSTGTSVFRVNSDGNVGIGTTTPVAKLEVNGNVKAGSATVSTLNYADDSSASDTYAMTLNPPIYAYTKGMMITFIANTANTGACTINVNGLGAKALKIRMNQDPTDNYISAGSVVVAVYDGTNFQMIQPAANAVSGDLTVEKNSSYGDQTFVPSTNLAKLGSFTVTAGSAEGVNITSIVVTLTSGNAASITNMLLKNNATNAQIGSTKVSPSTSNTYSTNLNIAQSGSLTVNIYGDISASAGIGSWVANAQVSGTGLVSFNAITGGGASNQLQTITFANGVLTAANGSHPATAILLAGSTGNNVAQFTFNAASEAYIIDKLKLKVGNNFSTSTSGVTVSYLDINGNTQTANTVFTSGDQPYATSTFTGLTIYVPANSSASINIYLDLFGAGSGATSGANSPIYIDYNEGFNATGQSGGDIKTSFGNSDLNSNTFYVRKSKPTFAMHNSGTNPSAMLLNFSIVGNATGNIDIKQLGFNIATTGCNVTSLYLYDPNTSSQLTTTPVTPTWNGSSGDVKLLVGGVDDNVLNIDTSVKSYQLRGTVTGYGAGDTISIHFKEDIAAGLTTSANAAGANGGANLNNTYNIWSDRSSGTHSTTTADWTNGFLLSNMSDAQNFLQ